MNSDLNEFEVPGRRDLTNKEVCDSYNYEIDLSERKALRKHDSLEFDNECHTIYEWSKIIGWSVGTIFKRLRNENLTLAQVLSKKKIYKIDEGTTKWKTPIQTKAYGVWRKMRLRCSDDPKNQDRKNYYERGIRVCERWINDFDAFFEDMGEPPLKHSLDRINNDGNYEPSNCRWADWNTQARNKRNNLLITRDGETKTLTEWSEITGVSATAISRRLKKGLPQQEIFSTTRVNAWKHGSITGYNDKKCRCQECINAYSAYRKKRKSLNSRG